MALAEFLLSAQGESLSVSLLGGFLESFFHCCELLGLVGSLWLLNSVDLDDESASSLYVHLSLSLNFFRRWWFILFLVNFDLLGGSLILFSFIISLEETSRLLVNGFG